MTKKSITFYVEEDLIREFKMACVSRDKIFSHVIEKLMVLYKNKVLSKKHESIEKFKSKKNYLVSHEIALPKEIIQILKKFPEANEPARQSFIKKVVETEKEIEEKVFEEFDIE